MIHQVPARLLPDLWPALLPFVESACKQHPFLKPEDVLAMGLAGKLQFFIAEEGQVQGFAAMEILEYTSSSIANVLAAGGQKGFLPVLLDEVFPKLWEWAQAKGAQDFCISGRPGWLRLMKPRGFEGIRYGMAYRRLS